jgi:hypothetical protein
MSLDTRMVVPSGGLDLSAPANAIPDSSLSRAFNWWHEPERGMCTRQGLAREDVTALAAPITAMHPYVDASGTMRLLVASGGKVWERTGAIWTEVTTLAGSEPPSFLTFNGACLIADSGAMGLSVYDGTSVTAIAGSPAHPTSLAEISGRVVCASQGAADQVFFSGPRDYSIWDIDAGALVIPAGFGDGYDITGFAVLYDTLVVSKVRRDADGNLLGRSLYGISTAGVPEQWSGISVSRENAASCQGAIVGVGSAAYMMDTNGFKAVAPAPNGQYGDIAVDTIVGIKINKLLAQIAPNADACTMTYVHSLAQIWCIVRTGSSARTVIYCPIHGVFTQVDFGTFKPRAVVEIGRWVYIAGDDGVLYRFSNKGTDELAPGVETPIAASLRTRFFEGLGGDLIVKRTKMVLDPLRPCTVIAEAVTADGVTKVELGRTDVGAGSAGQPLYDAYDKLIDADYPLADSALRVEPVLYGGPRSSGIALQLRTLGGRVVLNSITAEFAVVGR